MSQIKKFIDRVANSEGRQLRDVIMPLNDAKELRDEIAKLLVDQQTTKPDVIEVVAKGDKW